MGKTFVYLPSQSLSCRRHVQRDVHVYPSHTTIAQAACDAACACRQNWILGHIMTLVLSLFCPSCPPPLSPRPINACPSCPPGPSLAPGRLPSIVIPFLSCDLLNFSVAHVASPRLCTCNCLGLGLLCTPYKPRSLTCLRAIVCSPHTTRQNTAFSADLVCCRNVAATTQERRQFGGCAPAGSWQCHALRLAIGGPPCHCMTRPAVSRRYALPLFSGGGMSAAAQLERLTPMHCRTTQCVTP